MKTKSTTKRTEGLLNGANTSDYTVESLPDMIRKRAYHICEARGCQPGREWEDWFQAEREIKHHLGL